MILRSIEPRYFGPFFSPTRLDIDPEVTVLTGPNDVGKSSLLRLISLLCLHPDCPAEERDVNFDYLHEQKVNWQQDAEIGCVATFLIPTREARGSFSGGLGGSSPFKEGDTVVARFQ